MISRLFSSIGEYALFVLSLVTTFRISRIETGEIVRQIIRIGVMSIPIVLLTAIFSGMVLALQTAYGMARFGAKLYVGNVVGLGMIRELAPVLTALMICGRVGAGIAAELGSMKVTEQIDAMRALGANPLHKLVVPRVLAAIVSVPVLVVFADVVGVAGGMIVAIYELGLTSYQYQQSLLYTVVVKDVLDGLVKSCIFGFLVVSIACFLGLSTRGGTVGVGSTTTKAVVVGSIVIFISNYIITKALFLI